MVINKDFAYAIADSLATFLKIPKVDIVFSKNDDSNSNIPGFYIPNSRIINVNSNVIKGFNELEFTSFLIHEMRHAYQDYYANNPSASIENPELLKVWKKEISNYKDPSSQIDYLTQNIEIDAVAFTSWFTKKFFNQNLMIPKEISEQVKKRMEEIEKKLFK